MSRTNFQVCATKYTNYQQREINFQQFVFLFLKETSTAVDLVGSLKRKKTFQVYNSNNDRTFLTKKKMKSSPFDIESVHCGTIEMLCKFC